MIGIDIEKIERFEKFNKKELNRIFTKKEIEYCNKYSQSYSHFAGMWCVKEAFIKALKNKTISLKDIEVLHNEDNSPYINITKKLEGYLIDTNYGYIDISISHTNEYATAVVQIL